MLKLIQQSIWVFVIIITFFVIQINFVRAQVISQAIGLAISLNEQANEGDIIVLTEQGYAVSNDPKESNIVGVVNFNPPILIKDKSFEGNQSFTPVITSGVTPVNVSNSNGDIKTGDFITVSSQKGIGERASTAGYVLGKALENFASQQSGKINVLVEIYFNNSGFEDKGTDTQATGIFGIFQISTQEIYKEPTKALRYLIALIILIASFIFAFASFGSVARNGIEALGRNPLAARKIQLGIFFNATIAIFIIAAGVAFAVIVAIF